MGYLYLDKSLFDGIRAEWGVTGKVGGEGEGDHEHWVPIYTQSISKSCDSIHCRKLDKVISLN